MILTVKKLLLLLLNANDNGVISGTIVSNTTWTADNIYELAGKVVVEEALR